MQESQINRLRHLAAALVTAIGLWQIAKLWLQHFSEDLLLEALWGGIYLLLALGLVGRSRFSLFATSVVCFGYIVWVLQTRGLATPLEGLVALINLCLTGLGLSLLWSLRHRGSV